MNKQYLTHDELQHIEHANKILEDHLAIVSKVCNETEAMLNTYVPILKVYVGSIAAIRHDFGQEVMHLIKSSRELTIMCGHTNEIVTYIQTVKRLGEIMTPEMVHMIEHLSGSLKAGKTPSSESRSSE